MFSRFRFAASIFLLMAVLSHCQTSGNLLMVEEEDSSLSPFVSPGSSALSVPPSSGGEVLSLQSSSGGRVRFSQGGEGWYAATPQGRLPVHSQAQEGVGSYLSWLSGQEDSVVRSRVHMIPSSASPTGVASVYLGKLGLMGGMPKHKSKVEWIPGPHMQLSSEDVCREVYNIPVGYRYKGYRIKPGSVVQRASCTIRYVEANSEEEIQRLIDTQGARAVEGTLSAEIPNVATLGSIEGGIRRARLSNQRLAQSAHFKHAALILYGKTKRNKLLRPASKIEMTLEVAVLEATPPSVPQASPSSLPLSTPPASDATSHLSSQIHRIESQYASHVAAQESIQRQLSEELSQASSARASLEAQLEALRAANASLSTEKESLSTQLASMKLSSPSSEDTVSVSSLGDSSAPPAPLVSSEAVPVAVEIVEESAPVPVVDAQSTALSSAAQLIHFRKQENPLLPLSAEESIQLLNMYIAEGVVNARKLSGREAIVVMGNTGAGKSTFLNYLMGCEMTTQDPEELGLVGLDDEVVVVLPRSAGGSLDEIMPIGHEKKSKTFLPHIEEDPRQEAPYAYCDCPGFLDNRWPEVNHRECGKYPQSASRSLERAPVNLDQLRYAEGRSRPWSFGHAEDLHAAIWE